MSNRAIDVTNITRVFGCTKDAYINRDSTYDEYTLYLVRDGTDSNGTHGYYTEAYYGDRRVTDVLVIDKNEYNILRDTARNQTYPDDKIYLIPYYSEDVKRLSGQSQISPVGYNICFKHKGIVTPITQSIIAGVEYDEDTGNISIIFNCEDGTQRAVVYPYELPTASHDVKGGIKVGVGLNITGNGVLSADVTRKDVDDYRSAWEAIAEELETGEPLNPIPVATPTTVGGIKIDQREFHLGEGNDSGKLFLNNKRSSLTYELATLIQEDSNLDYFFTEGSYYFPYAESSVPGNIHHVINRPNVYPFFLDIVKTTGVGRIFQIAYTLYNDSSIIRKKLSGVYVRRKIDNTTPTEPEHPGPGATEEEISEYELKLSQDHSLWTYWEQLSTRDELIKRLSNDYDYSVEIEKYTDLDDYLEPNTYYIDTTEEAQLIYNTPLNRPFMMHVIRTTGMGRTYQLVESYRDVSSPMSGIYVRRKIDSSTTPPIDVFTLPKPAEDEHTTQADRILYYNSRNAGDDHIAERDARITWHKKWSEWQMLVTQGEMSSTSFVIRRLLTSDDDLDLITESGIYHLSTDSLPKNTPGRLSGDLLVYNPNRSRGYWITQQLQNSEGLYQRFQSNIQNKDTQSRWYDWIRVGNENGRQIRVMQYNIGAFHCGYKSNRGQIYWDHTLDEVSGSLQEKLRNYKKFFAKTQPDIIGIQEYSRYMGVDDARLKDQSTPEVGTWNDLLKEMYSHMTSSSPSSASASRYIISNFPMRYIKNYSGYISSLYLTYKPLGDEKEEDYRRLSRIPDVEPVSGVTNIGTVRGTVSTSTGLGTAVKGGKYQNSDTAEMYVSGRRIAVASLAGPNGTDKINLAEAYLTNLVASPYAPEYPNEGDYWHRVEVIFKYENSQWVDTKWTIPVSDEAPTSPTENDIWYKPGEGFYQWNGLEWTLMFNTYTSDTEPQDPVEGSLWYLVGGLFRWNGSSWDVTNCVIFSDEVPENPIVYDFWYKSEVICYWDGTYWVADTRAVISSDVPKNPIEGDIWYSLSVNGEIYKYVEDTWIDITNEVPVSSSAPENPEEGDVWYKSSKPAGFYSYDGSSWVHVDESYTSAVEPKSPSEGALWYMVISNQGFYKYEGSDWVPVIGSGPSESAPSNPSQGRLWYKTSYPGGFFQWDGSKWFIPSYSAELYRQTVLETKLNFFSQLSNLFNMYNSAIIITDSNAPDSFNGTNYHLNLVGMMESNGYLVAQDMGGEYESIITDDIYKYIDGKWINLSLKTVRIYEYDSVNDKWVSTSVDQKVSPEPPVYPEGEGPLQGDLWYKSSTPKGFYIYDGEDWTKFAGGVVQVSRVAPLYPVQDDLWYKLNDPDKGFYVYDGTDWVQPSESYVSSSLPDPETTNEGALWYKLTKTRSYWDAQCSYVRHGEEQVFLDHMDEYLNEKDLVKRYELTGNDMGNGKNNFTCIDNIFVKGNIRMQNVEVLAEDWESLASDHIPLIVDLVVS